jgi:hypothetical protein
MEEEYRLLIDVSVPSNRTGLKMDAEDNIEIQRYSSTSLKEIGWEVVN